MANSFTANPHLIPQMKKPGEKKEKEEDTLGYTLNRLSPLLLISSE